MYAGGCLHTEIAEYFPELEKFLPLHLSRLDGTPMHVFGNAKHWAKEKDARILSKHLRIDTEKAQAICEADEAEAIYMIAKTIINMEPIWKKEAEDLLSYIKKHETT